LANIRCSIFRVTVTGKEKQQSKKREVRKGESHYFVVFSKLSWFLEFRMQTEELTSDFAMSVFLINAIRFSGYFNDLSDVLGTKL